MLIYFTSNECVYAYQVQKWLTTNKHTCVVVKVSQIHYFVLLIHSCHNTACVQLLDRVLAIDILQPTFLYSPSTYENNECNYNSSKKEFP